MRPQRFRWLVGGAIVGAVCWLPTVLQEMFGSPRNLSLLLTAHRSAGAGLSFGLKSLEFAGALRPIWTVPSPILYARLGGTSVAGLILLVVVGTVAFFAWKSKNYDLATLGLISVLLSLCTLVTFASIPANLVQRAAYLDRVLWLVGTLDWVVLIWGVVLIAPSLVRYADRRSMSLPTTITSTSNRLICGALAVALLALLSVAGVDALITATRRQVDPHQIALVDQSAKQIEELTSKGRVNVQFESNLTAFEGYDIGQGVAWKLTTDGWQPQLTSNFTSTSGIPYTHSIYFPSVKVTLSSSGSRVALVHIGG